ncbi:MAG: hypothetical protein AB1483_04410 [Candidatus Zixiibacteriota bacterium]
MAIEKSRSKEQIFANMHRELRKWNPEIPESVDRLDPVLKILLQLYAHQLERIDRRIDQTWEVAVSSLIRTMAPESQRWPVPAYTIMRCQPIDPVVEIDPHTRFFFKEKREGGQTFFFSSQKTEKLVAADAKYIFARFNDAVFDLSPNSAGHGGQPAISDAQLKSKGAGQIYIGVEYSGMPTGLRKATLCLMGVETVLRQMRWGYWVPGSAAGGFYEDSSFCPGLTTSLEDLFSDDGEPVDWGGLRTSVDLFRPLENNFIVLPDKFTSTWEMGSADAALVNHIDDDETKYAVEQDKLYWIRVDLPAGGDKVKVKSGFKLYFNCFVATNKNGLSTYKYTGGNRLVEVEIPEPIDTILGITSVIDSNRNEYVPRHEMSIKSTDQCYTLEERGDRLVLWFDYTSQLDVPPDNITVYYTVTAGTSANGIEAGQICELYERHPGVGEAENITVTRGAIPAKTEKQIVTEVSSRLRNRDRALNFREIAGWTQTFDPRIKGVECVNSIERAGRGVRRCVLVKVRVSAEDFYSEDESGLLKQRLKQFLKSRAPVNTAFQVEIVAR